jgi:shikimate kinase
MSETAPHRSALEEPEAAIVAALGQRSVVLVGMMGVGKSTIGRRLAVRLGLQFTDADHEIEVAHAGMTIPEIFTEHGEPYFRDGEARVIARLLEGPPGVLATGGGAFMREDTRDRIRAKAVSIWLRADAEIILRRVKRRADRPLLQTEDPAETIKQLIEIRYPVYQSADLMVVSRDEPHEKVVDDCIAVLSDHLCRAERTASHLSKIE